MAKHLLIDVGSTHIKWTSMDETGLRGPEKRLPFPRRLPGLENIHEVDLESIVQRIFAILEEAGTMTSLWLATQMHGYVLADETGHPLTPYIAWQDKRALGKPMPFTLSPSYGVHLKANLPRASIEVIRQTNPDLYARVTQFFTLGSYLIYRLIGLNATHITEAAPSGFYDAGKPISTPFNLPNACQQIKPLGKIGTCLVYPPVGDQQASVYGANDYNEAMILNLGTAAQLCTLAPGRVYGDFESRPFFGPYTLCTVTGLPGGREIDQQDALRELEDTMVSRYQAALKQLPKRSKLVLIGGVINHHAPLLERVTQRLGWHQVTYDHHADALEGLRRLAIKHVPLTG